VNPHRIREEKGAHYSPAFVAKDDWERPLIPNNEQVYEEEVARSGTISQVLTSGSEPLRVYSSVWQMPCRIEVVKDRHMYVWEATRLCGEFGF
jgi:hypothetical protein